MNADLDSIEYHIQGVNHAAVCSNVAWLEFGDCRADLGDTADDLMSRNAWIDSGHRAPLATDLEVRVADTSKKDFNLNVVFARIAPEDHGGGKRRFCTIRSISLGFILTTACYFYLTQTSGFHFNNI